MRTLNRKVLTDLLEVSNELGKLQFPYVEWFDHNRTTRYKAIKNAYEYCRTLATEPCRISTDDVLSDAMDAVRETFPDAKYGSLSLRGVGIDRIEMGKTLSQYEFNRDVGSFTPSRYFTLGVDYPNVYGFVYDPQQDKDLIYGIVSPVAEIIINTDEFCMFINGPLFPMQLIDENDDTNDEEYT